MAKLGGIQMRKRLSRCLEREAPDWIAAPLIALFIVALIAWADILSAGPPAP
jgi:hypothetical protein